MYLTCKVVLKPNKAQEQFFWDSADAARFAYNRALALKIEVYNTTGINVGWMDISKEVIKLKYDEDYKWLSKIPSETLKMAVRDMDSAFTKFLTVLDFQSLRRRIE